VTKASAQRREVEPDTAARHTDEVGASRENGKTSENAAALAKALAGGSGDTGTAAKIGFETEAIEHGDSGHEITAATTTNQSAMIDTFTKRIESFAATTKFSGWPFYLKELEHIARTAYIEFLALTTLADYPMGYPWAEGWEDL
jgi:hypothetical protein